VAKKSKPKDIEKPDVYLNVCRAVRTAGEVVVALAGLAAQTHKTIYLYHARDQANETAAMLTRLIERAEAAKEEATEE